MGARFNALFSAHPDAVIAHRDLTALTDHDLRTALEDAETLVERLSWMKARRVAGPSKAAQAREQRLEEVRACACRALAASDVTEPNHIDVDHIAAGTVFSLLWMPPC